MTCTKLIKPAVEVVYEQFPKFTTEASGLSDLFIAVAFIVLLGAIILSIMHLFNK